jgi:tRNA dimethylallyltransferase
MKKVLILLGPTGVGKTGLSLLIAKALDTDIISADSMQIYRHMDIGTAKPTPWERKDITHHMIDIADPWETYSTGKYIAAVKPIIEELLGQGRIPVIVGGTGLYIRSMTRGIFSGPSADWPLRDELLSREQEAKGTLYNYLKTLDPVAVRTITPTDTRRLIRALEVCFRSGAKISEMQKTLTRPLPYEFIKIGITRERQELYRLIEERVDAMLNAGLIEEVKRVIKLIKEHAGTLDPRCIIQGKNLVSNIMDHTYLTVPSMQAIGYKEIVRHLGGEMSLTEAVDIIKKSSKRYAKRQFTWFRKEEDIRWVDATGIMDPREILRKIYPLLSGIILPENRHQPCNIE